MKRIFLLFGIAVFSSASGQQKDLFDIGKHLQKKQAEGKKAAERKQLLLPKRNSLGVFSPYINNYPELTYTLPNGDLVVTLPQDHMPCIVPGNTMHHFMPNLYQRKFTHHIPFPFRNQPGQIPNPALPFRMLVSK